MLTLGRFRFVILVICGAQLCACELARIRQEGGNLVTSSTLQWVPGVGKTPEHAVPLTEDDPATVYCRANYHGAWVGGALHGGVCMVPFLGSVSKAKGNFEVLVSLNGSARVKRVSWDKYSAAPNNAVASAPQQFLAYKLGKEGFPNAGFLVPHERRAHLVVGSHVAKSEEATVLTEDEPVRYYLQAVKLDKTKSNIRTEDIVLEEVTMSNPGPSHHRIVELTEVQVRHLIYWGQVKGTLVGLPAHVTFPVPENEERDITWGIQNEYDRIHSLILEYDLQPGTGCNATVIGTVRKTEGPYVGSLTSVYRDGTQRSRVIEGLHIDERLILLQAVYSSPYFLHNHTKLDVAEVSQVLYRSTTTTTTTSTTTTTPSPPQASMVNPESPKSDSLSTSSAGKTGRRHIRNGTGSSAGISSPPAASLLTVILLLIYK